MNQFNQTGINHPGRSVFDLSYRKKLTCDMGQLIPVMCDEVVPGDYFKISTEMLIRFQPLVAPIMHEVNAFVHYFFVPYRLLWSSWEDWITGGADGQFVGTLPQWNPTNNAVGSLWDYLGFPTGVNPTGALPIDFPRSAYNFIYNEYYRDENIIAEVALTNENILKRAWEKDYFTSALPWQQRGIAPALPISGTTSAVWSIADTSDAGGVQTWQVATAANDFKLYNSVGGNVPHNQIGFLNKNKVDLASATTFNVADLRLAFQIQRWMERNARAGARYTEFLNAHFGVSPRDDRLQRPEYIGGMRSPIVVSEVLKTSSDGSTPQANMAGHGITGDRQFAGDYKATEFGLIMGIMSIMPRSAYQQGIDRQWLRSTKYDFYFPEFANLSEQAIQRAEIYASGVQAENQTVFGYQGRYDEMRVKRDLVCGQMRSTFAYWHLGRIFGSAPLLNQSFVECNPDKRIFAVQSDPGLIVHVGNIIRAVRPIPIMSQPGMIDHG